MSDSSEPEPALYEFDINSAFGRLQVIASKKTAGYITDCIAEAEEAMVLTYLHGRVWRRSDPEDSDLSFENADEAVRHLHDSVEGSEPGGRAGNDTDEEPRKEGKP